MKIKRLFGKTYFIFNKTRSTQAIFKQIENVKNQNPVYLVHTKKHKIAYQEGENNERNRRKDDRSSNREPKK